MKPNNHKLSKWNTSDIKPALSGWYHVKLTKDHSAAWRYYDATKKRWFGPSRGDLVRFVTLEEMQKYRTNPNVEMFLSTFGSVDHFMKREYWRGIVEKK